MSSSLQRYIAKVILLSIFIVCVFNKISANECKGVDTESKHLQLKQALLCNYDKYTRPGSNEKNATQITLWIKPQLLKSDDPRSSVTFGLRLAFQWKDARLQWDSKQYGGDKFTRLASDDIWTPEILAYDGNENYFTKLKCTIIPKGGIQCSFNTKYTTTCEADFSDWPYDILDCTLTFSLWSYSSEQVNFIESYIIMQQIVPDHKEWDLVSYGSLNDTDSFKFDEKYDSSSVQVYILLKSHGNNYRTAYVVPAFVMVVMTLTILWLDSKSSERLFLAIFNFIIHFMCLLNIFWQAPFNGTSTPKLVVFYEKSLIAATFAFVTTAFLRELEEIQVSPPQWISSLAIPLMKSKIGRYLVHGVLNPNVSDGFILFDEDDNEQLVSSKNKNQSTWRCISIVISSVIFFLAIIFYSALMLFYLL